MLHQLYMLYWTRLFCNIGLLLLQYMLRSKTFLILIGFYTINDIFHATHDTIWLHTIHNLQTTPGPYDNSLTLQITWHVHSTFLKHVSNMSAVKFSVQSCLVHFNTQLLLICAEIFTYGLLIFQNPIALLLISKHNKRKQFFILQRHFHIFSPSSDISYLFLCSMCFCTDLVYKISITLTEIPSNKKLHHVINGLHNNWYVSQY